MTKRELAQIVGCSPRSIENYVRAGLPHAGKSNGRVWFSLDVLEWIGRWRAGERPPEFG